jgi:CRP-like cAMP-binding protein
MKRQTAYAVIPYLRDLPLFSDMPACELERLSEDCIVRQASRGELLFQAGDPCDELHAVISGQVKLFVLAANGQEKVLDLIRPGQAFAEALMFSNLPYLVNAQAWWTPPC